MKFGINTHDKEAFSNIAVFDIDSIKTAVNPVNRIKRGIKDGFKHFEISYDIDLVLPGFFDNKKLEDMLDLKERYGLTFSVHLPFRSIELDYPHPYIYKAYAGLISDAIINVLPLQAESYVLHATGKLPDKIMGMPAEAYLLKHLLEYSSRAIVEILDKTHISPDKIAVENVDIPFDRMDEMIDELGLSVCMDAGHILSGVSGDFTLKGFLDKYYDRIIEIHFHDGYNRYNSDGHKSKAHLALGKGDMDPVWFINELKKRGYDKALVFEMAKYDDALESYNKIKGLFPDILV